jgi:UDP-N-acetylglucosamine transferase subunit ALG13
MIFVTVGTQLPFDRLLQAMDAWAARHGDVEVLAQTGQTECHYPHLIATPHMDQKRFADNVARAQVIVAHAGMGTILTAIEIGKPVILMPRRADLGEHRNDHQRDTAAEMSALANVTVVEDAPGLFSAIDAALTQASNPCIATRTSFASAQLLDAVKEFIWSEPVTAAPRIKWQARVARR